VIKQTIGQDLPEGFQTAIPPRSWDDRRRRSPWRIAGHDRQLLRHMTARGRLRPPTDLRRRRSVSFRSTSRSYQVEPWATEALLDVLGHPERHFPAIHIGARTARGPPGLRPNELAGARVARRSVFLPPSQYLPASGSRSMVSDREDGVREWTAQLKLHIERVDRASSKRPPPSLSRSRGSGRRHRRHRSRAGRPLDAPKRADTARHGSHEDRAGARRIPGSDLKGIAREKAGIANVGPVRHRRMPIRHPGRARAGGQTPGRRADHHGRYDAAAAKGIRTGGCWQASNRHAPLRTPFSMRYQAIRAGRETTCPASFAYPIFRPLRSSRQVDLRWAHNPDGMRVVAQALPNRVRISPPLHALVGIRNDKDWRAMLNSLRPLSTASR